jgi:glucokinase
MHLLAVEIGGSKLQICAGTGDGKIVDRRRFVVDRTAGGDGIRRQIFGALPELMEQWAPGAIGVGYGGPVRWRTGEIIKSYHIAGWDGFPLGATLAERTGLPVFVENDSNTAAYGEAIHGAGRGFSPVLYSNLGSGVGGGLVVDGRLYHGAEPGEVEVGHLRLERDGTIVEDRCSGWGVDRRIRYEIEHAPDGRLAQLAAGKTGGEAKFLAAALKEGDAMAELILRESMREYAFALSHAVHLLHPEIIVLGGGLSLIGEPLRAAVAEELPKYLMDAFHPGPRIALSTLGEDVVPVGALALAGMGLKNGFTTGGSAA